MWANTWGSKPWTGALYNDGKVRPTFNGMESLRIALTYNQIYVWLVACLWSREHSEWYLGKWQELRLSSVHMLASTELSRGLFTPSQDNNKKTLSVPGIIPPTFCTGLLSLCNTSNIIMPQLFFTYDSLCLTILLNEWSMLSSRCGYISFGIHHDQWWPLQKSSS